MYEPMTTGVMYDAAFVPVAAIVARKPDVMGLYTDGGHAASLATVKTLRDANIPIWPNHENAANELLGGSKAGAGAAQRATAAVESWGCPSDGSVDIVYSVDVNTPTTQFSQVGDAFDAINGVHQGAFIAKCYGEGALIDWLVSQSLIKPGDWLSASSSFPGYSVNDGNVAVWQQVGTDIASTDRDVITHLELMGAWGLDNSMALTEDDLNNIALKVLGYPIAVPKEWDTASTPGTQPFAYVASQTLSLSTVLFDANKTAAADKADILAAIGKVGTAAGLTPAQIADALQITVKS